MSTIKKLSEQELSAKLEDHPYWTIKEDKLFRRLIFPGFVEAFGFMTQVAILAEQANHHPEWANVHRTVDIFMTTHEAGGITERDFALIEKMEKLID